MRNLVPALWTFAWILATGIPASAQQNGTEYLQTVPTVHAYNLPHQRGCSLKRLCQWLTYRPLPVPQCCQGCQWETTSLPPMYTYFIGVYGPRSPGMGYPIYHPASVFQGAGLTTGRIASPSHGMVVINARSVPKAPMVRDLPQRVAEYNPVDSSKIEIIVPAENHREIPHHSSSASQEIQVHGVAGGSEIQVHEGAPRNAPIRDVNSPSLPQDN